jgi:hypothetical protein
MKPAGFRVADMRKARFSKLYRKKAGETAKLLAVS